jgi:universal stress protein A
MKEIKRILVVSKFSKECRKAIHYGISLSKKYKAKLYILHVIHDPLAAWDLPMMNIHPAREEYKRIREDIKSHLDSIISSERKEGFDITEYVKEGKPLDEILRVVEEENIDLLITLAHKEGRLEHLLFCRDIESIIRKMPCSIMLLKEDFP